MRPIGTYSVCRNPCRARIEERRGCHGETYGDHAGYVRRVEQSVRKIVGERLLLAEDGELLIAKAKSEEIAKRFAPK